MRRWIVLLVVVASAIGAAVAVELTREPVEGPVLDSLPEGVSHHQIEGVAVFLVRNGRQVDGFLDSTQHLPGEHLWWCVDEEVFLAPWHAELFNADGQLIEGPAFRDLDRVRVTVAADGVVKVGPRHLLRGTVRKGVGLRSTGVPPTVWAAYSNWIRDTSGSRHFCQQHIGTES
jgi:nitrite reductase/ring-hydroxylating ferredoxin subunit